MKGTGLYKQPLCWVDYIYFMGIIMRELTGDNRFLSAAEEGSIGGSTF
jgi:hypothetical protein